MNHRFFKDSLLLVSIIIFGCVSALMTYQGIMRLFGGAEEQGVQVIAVALAVAFSLVMIYASLEISSSERTKSFRILILTHVTFASFSLFFNFNAFIAYNFRDSQQSKLIGNYKISIHKIIFQGRNAADAYYQLDKKKREVVSLEFAAKNEKNYFNRKGEGPKYQEIQNRLSKAKSSLKSATNEHKEYISAINSKNSQIEKALNNYITRQITFQTLQTTIRVLHAEIGDLVKKIFPRYVYAPLRKQAIAEDPKFSVNLILSFLTFDPHLSWDDKIAITISLFISIVLDFPLFFIIVFLHRPTSHSSNNLPGNMLNSRNNPASKPFKWKNQ